MKEQETYHHQIIDEYFNQEDVSNECICCGDNGNNFVSCDDCTNWVCLECIATTKTNQKGPYHLDGEHCWPCRWKLSINEWKDLYNSDEITKKEMDKRISIIEELIKDYNKRL